MVIKEPWENCVRYGCENCKEIVSSEDLFIRNERAKAQIARWELTKENNEPLIKLLCKKCREQEEHEQKNLLTELETKI